MGFCRLLYNRTLLPDSMRRNPWSLYIFVGILVLLVLLPIRVHFWMLIVGMILGYIYAAPGLVIRAMDGEGSSSLRSTILSPLKIKDKSQERDFVRLAISPVIDAELDYFLTALLKEVIDAWYVRLCLSGESDFQSCVRSTVNATIMNLLRYGQNNSKDVIALILYGLTNALICSHGRVSLI